KSIIEHQIDALSVINELKQIYIVGNYESISEKFSLLQCASRDDLKISYVNEEILHGTAGSLIFLKKNSLIDNYDTLIVSHGDVVCDFPFDEMVEYQKQKESDSPQNVVLATHVRAPKDVSHHFGSIVSDNCSRVIHYVEKPHTCISNQINAGIAVFDSSILDILLNIASKNESPNLDLGRDLYPVLVENKSLFSFPLNSMWCSVKNPSGALHANKLLLALDGNSNFPNCTVTGLVYVHETAIIDPSAFVFFLLLFKIGPNVSIGAGCVVKPGVRISESILLNGSVINENCLIKDSIVGIDCIIEPWCRIEGKHTDEYFDYFRKVKGKYSYFTVGGKLYPSVTVLGSNVVVRKMQMIYNSIILPFKDIAFDCTSEIIL
ncbi:hypothetical protein MXB_2370, partial [Myxobolus squamalis]